MSDGYWRKRAERHAEATAKRQEGYDKEINSIYLAMTDSVQSRIDAFYQKYADKNGLTMAQAKKAVSKVDIKAYEAQAKKYVAEARAGKDDAFSDEANKQMELYNLTMKVNRLEMLKSQIGMELVKGNSDLEKYFGKTLTDEAQAEYREQAGILGRTITPEQAKRGANAIARADYQHATWSQRIWTHQEALKGELCRQLEQAIIAGKGGRELAREIQKTFQTSAYNARRLMVTEIARVQTDVARNSMEENGNTEYQYLATGPRPCEICKALDGKVFKISEMIPGENAPPMHPFCVLPNTEVIAPGLEALTRSEYSGDVVEILTAKGRRLTVTPNHIVLTARGWVRAKNLVKTDKVITYSGYVGSNGIKEPTDNKCPAAIENLFTAALESSRSTAVCMKATAVDFKGDVVPDSEVDIVPVNSKLRDKLNASMGKLISNNALISTGETAETVLRGNGLISKTLVTLGLTSDGIISRLGKRSPLIWSHMSFSELLRFRTSSDYDMRLKKSAVNGSAGNTVSFRKSKFGFTGIICRNNSGSIKNLPGARGWTELNAAVNQNLLNESITLVNDAGDIAVTLPRFIERDNVISVKRYFFSGHVYDASSESTLYISNGIVTSNCHCSTSPYWDEEKYQKWLDSGAAKNGIKFEDFYPEKGVDGEQLYERWDTLNAEERSERSKMQLAMNEARTAQYNAERYDEYAKNAEKELSGKTISELQAEAEQLEKELSGYKTILDKWYDRPDRGTPEREAWNEWLKKNGGDNRMNELSAKQMKASARLSSIHGEQINIRNAERYKNEAEKARERKKNFESAAQEHREKMEQAKAKADSAAKEYEKATRKGIYFTQTFKAMQKYADDRKVEVNPVKKMDKIPSEKEIIKKLAGGDKTKGSCASLAYCYAANKAGYDVTDYRGGASRELCSYSTAEMFGIATGNNGALEYHIAQKEAPEAAAELMKIEAGKEYILTTGRHAAVVRRNPDSENRFQYLEMQSGIENGWLDLGEKKKEIVDNLNWRWKALKTRPGHYMLTDVDDIKPSEELETMLGYINTAKEKQQKGREGTIR